MTKRAGALLSYTSLLIAIYIVYHFLTLSFNHAVNLPIWDDFDAGLFFLNKYTDASTLREKLWLVYEQHNEHRILVNKILTLATVWLTGEVNFAYMIYCSTIILATLAVLTGAYSKEWKFTILITTSILLQPQLGDGLNWVTTSVASFFLCFFALVCSILISKPKINYYILLPLMALACYSQGNGILLPFCLALALVFDKRWKDAIIILSVGAVTCFLYFTNYNPPQQSQKLYELYGNLDKLFDYGFTIVGASLGFSNKLASFTCGIVLTVLFVLVLIFSKLRRNSPLIAFLFFLFLSSALNTAARGLSSTDFAISPGRYTILSSGILAGLAFIYYEFLALRSIKIRFLFIPLALTFNFYSYKYYFGAVEGLYVRTINDMALYFLTDKGLTYPWPHRGIPIYEESLKRGLYHLPIEELDLEKRVEINTNEFIGTRKNLKTYVNRVQLGKEFIVIEGWGFITTCTSGETTTYINLVKYEPAGEDAKISTIEEIEPVSNSNPGAKDQSPSQITIQALKKPRPDVGNRFSDVEHHASGYFTIFPRAWIKEGDTYKFELLLECPDSKYKQKTRYFVSRDKIQYLDK